MMVLLVDTFYVAITGARKGRNQAKMASFYGSLDMLSISNSSNQEDKVHEKSQSVCLFGGGIRIRTQQRLSPEQSETQIQSKKEKANRLVLTWAGSKSINWSNLLMGAFCQSPSSSSLIVNHKTVTFACTCLKSSTSTKSSRSTSFSKIKFNVSLTKLKSIWAHFNRPTCNWLIYVTCTLTSEQITKNNIHSFYYRPFCTLIQLWRQRKSSSDWPTGIIIRRSPRDGAAQAPSRHQQHDRFDPPPSEPWSTGELHWESEEHHLTLVKLDFGGAKASKHLSEVFAVQQQHFLNRSVRTLQRYDKGGRLLSAP